MPVGSIWVGVDVGKTHHHVAAVDDAGKVVLSRQATNDGSVALSVGKIDRLGL